MTRRLLLAVIPAGIAVSLGCENPHRTRSEMEDAFEDVSEKVEEAAGEFVDAADEAADVFEDAADELGEAVEEAAEETRKALERENRGSENEAQ